MLVLVLKVPPSTSQSNAVHDLTELYQTTRCILDAGQGLQIVITRKNGKNTKREVFYRARSLPRETKYDHSLSLEDQVLTHVAGT